MIVCCVLVLALPPLFFCGLTGGAQLYWLTTHDSAGRTQLPPLLPLGGPPGGVFRVVLDPMRQRLPVAPYRVRRRPYSGNW
jgi:hypothetical protein